MVTNLTEQAIEGYLAGPTAKPPYLATSNSDAAWRLGQWLQRTGRTLPRDCRPSRGDTYHCNDMKWRVSYQKGISQITRET